MPDIRILTPEDILDALQGLADVLVDCVDGGASVSFMAPMDRGLAETFFRSTAAAVESGTTVLLVAEVDGRIAGTVQLGLAQTPNQPHRADVKKLLVHSAYRGRGLSRQLMDAAERAALARGRWLLVLDTATGEPAEAIYEHLGWSRAGVIPDYALFPDGRYCSTTLFYKRLQEDGAKAVPQREAMR